MRRIYAFNGDADGLCALQQLRLAESRDTLLEAELVSGTKRETTLVSRVRASAGDRVTVLDMSFEGNRGSVERLLAAGAHVRYFDHHYAGAPFEHAGFEPYLDSSAATCTSAIVDRYLKGRERLWAIVGAFGDNLDETAAALADVERVPQDRRAQLRRLGVALNYNAYGETEADLFYAPLALHERLIGYRDPFEFIAGDRAFDTLWQGYSGDLALTEAILPVEASAFAAAYRLPDAPWARRVNGVFANRLARASPQRAHAVLLPTTLGGVTVSVRAPLERPSGAAALCRGYPGGGGREGAAGITNLPLADVSDFLRRFMAHFSM